MTENKGNSTVEAKATQFANLYRQPTGWRLAWLVVSSCERGQGDGVNTIYRDRVATSGHPDKVSLRRFAELADVSRATVQYFYQAWELAADSGQVPHAKDVPNTDTWDHLLVDYGIDKFDLETDDHDKEPEWHWSHWYQQAKRGTKTVAQQQELATKIKEKKEEVKKEKVDDGVKQNPKPKQDNKTPESNEVKLRGNLMAIRRTLASSIELVQDSDSESVLGYIEQVRDALDALEQYLKGGSMDDALKALLTEES